MLQDMEMLARDILKTRYQGDRHGHGDRCLWILGDSGSQKADRSLEPISSLMTSVASHTITANLDHSRGISQLYTWFLIKPILPDTTVTMKFQPKPIRGVITK